jgi:ABC-type lipoprotein export system ATPase subunit
MGTERPGATEVLRLESVEKVYPHAAGGVAALSDVGLTVGKGEFVTITGPSGSGKTTLLLTMGGLIHPTRGKVLMLGVTVYLLASDRAPEEPVGQILASGLALSGLFVVFAAVMLRRALARQSPVPAYSPSSI